MKRRILGLFLALCMFIALLPSFSPNASAVETGVASYSHLDALEEQLKAAILLGQTSINISSYDTTSADALMISPYWHVFRCGLYYSGDRYTTISIGNTMGTDETETTVERLETEIAKIDALVAAQPTEERKALALHDYLTAEYSYDLNYENYWTGEFLLDKTGVCQAYADTYRYFLNRAGMECYTTESGEMNHAWNIVRVDGQYYHVDVTWDDPLPDIPGQAYHLFFLLSDEAVKTDRSLADSAHFGWDRTDLVCSSTKYDNAFWKEITSPVVIESGNYYYVDQTGIRCRNISTGSETVLKSDLGRWPVWGMESSGLHWIGVFSGLFLYDGYLYYNTATELRRVLPDGKGDECAYKPDISNGYIYSCCLINGELAYGIAESPNETPKVVFCHKIHTYVDGVCTFCGAKQSDEPTVKLPFTDVPTKSWYRSAVEYVTRHNLMSGLEDTIFGPNDNMTRGMLVTVLWRYAEKPENPEWTNDFRDVPNGRYFTKAVIWAANNGIVSGIGDGVFGPDDNVTREQLAAILFRYANKLKLDTSDRGSFDAFADRNSVSNYAKDAISWAVAKGIMSGDKQGSTLYLMPKDNATRAQVASMLMRYIENVLK